MDAMNMPKSILPSLQTIIEDFSQFSFHLSDDFYYSAREDCIYYNPAYLDDEAGVFQLLHEIGHALSGHHHFESGIELLRMETEAWNREQKIAANYQLVIPDAIVEHCIDSYRDWLHMRSQCPRCQNISIETSSSHYRCFNCGQEWSVPTHQRSRCYRLRSLQAQRK